MLYLLAPRGFSPYERRWRMTELRKDATPMGMEEYESEIDDCDVVPVMDYDDPAYAEALSIEAEASEELEP